MTLSIARPESAISSAELELRSHLSSLLEEARACMAMLPYPSPKYPYVESAATLALLETLGELLAEALHLNTALRQVPALSLDGNLSSGAATIGLGALADALSLVRAAVDEHSAG